MSQDITPTINSKKFIIQSKIDNQEFIVDEKVINSSSLLKNICDITEIIESILVDCSGESLEVFIYLIDHYQFIEDEHDGKFEKDLFDSFTSNDKQKLIKLIQDLCILDSDFFLDSIADYILGILGDEEKMDWKDIQIYLGLEDDFSETERKLILKEEKELEYFLSIDTENFKFPFANKNLYSLKTDFSTPMNVLIARIVKRSNEKISYLLSLINKTLKNEVDRHPIKLKKINAGGQCWNLNIYFENLRRGFTFYLNSEVYDEKYFNVLKQRKVIAEDISAYYINPKAPIISSNSINFVISHKAEVKFSKSYKSMFQFDITKCSIPSIHYIFSTLQETEVEFEEIYNHLIAKDLTKEIRILIPNDFFKFFYLQILIRLYKKPNASKFETMEFNDCDRIFPKFRDFVTDYMEDNGIIKSELMIPGIPLKKVGVEKIKRFYHYPVSVVKKYLDSIVTL